MKINKKYIMSLLYLQTRELKNKAGHDIESQKCVLISKEFLDKYKNDNNYNNMKNSSDYLLNIADSGYEEQKKVLRQKYNIDENKLPVMDSILVIEINWSLEKQFLDIDNIEYPDKMEIVSYKYFQDCYKGKIFNKTYDVLFASDAVIIIDNDMIYLCSLIKGGENEYNFQVKVDVLLKFQNPEIIKNEVEYMVKYGLKNYFKFHNINQDFNKKQELKNQIGFLINIKKENEENNIVNSFSPRNSFSKPYDNNFYLGENDNNKKVKQKQESAQNNINKNNNNLGQDSNLYNSNQNKNFSNHNQNKQENEKYISNNQMGNMNSNSEKKSNENNIQNNINSQNNQNSGNLNNNNLNALNKEHENPQNLDNSNHKVNLTDNQNYLSSDQMPNLNNQNSSGFNYNQPGNQNEGEINHSQLNEVQNSKNKLYEIYQNS